MLPTACSFVLKEYDAMAYLLRFITGKHAGGEFPLKPNREFFIGRGSEFDMVLDDDLVSRRHARITTFGDEVRVQDLDSTNGTLVNGELISEHALKVSDKVGIGHSIIQLVEIDTSAAKMPIGQPVRADQPDRKSTVFKQGLEGTFPGPGTTIPELISMVARFNKNAVLDLADESGQRIKVYFRDGSIISSRVRTPTELEDLLPAKKALFRAMAFSSGRFKVRGFATDRVFQDVLSEDLDALLSAGEAHREQVERYRTMIPDAISTFALVSPLEPKLSELSPEALDTLQLVLNFGELESILNHSEANDSDTYQDLIYLLQTHYVAPGQ